MKNGFYSVAEAGGLIASGSAFMIAGAEEALTQLPKGKWIGGTSVYFLTKNGGICDRDRVFVTEIDQASASHIVYHAPQDLAQIPMGRYDHGMSLILIPAYSKAHAEFALEGANYPGLFDQPLMGWITGVHLDEIGVKDPKIVNGQTGEVYSEGAILLHVELPQHLEPVIDIVNIFNPSEDGDVITFTQTGFGATRAIVNGQEVDFASYLTESKQNTRLPLVANYAGAKINTSFMSVDDTGVSFFAPVIQGVEYRFASTPKSCLTGYLDSSDLSAGEELSCNCILNYAYCELEGQKTGNFVGPATFGEIAYILLNQTMVHVKLAAQEAVKAS
ncbi:MAG: DUF6976 family protein [Mangrovicoccus sp.]